MQQYSAAFTSEWLLQNEMRIFLRLEREGKSPVEIRAQVIEENLFRMKRQNTIIAALKVINRRLRFLDPVLRRMFLENQRHDRLAVLLYSFLKSYRLPREFVLEILRHHWLNHKNRLPAGEVVSFFEYKGEQSQIVADWSPETKKKLRQVMLRFLTECGLLQSQNDYWLITPVLLGAELRAFVDTEPKYNDFTALMLNA
ncbi:DUF1819 family protein [Pelotomaculum isophthalicicum JI]|uniref:DUF1819 family protein n=1 Tax=Pelotomaculum isophthalicicum JI TaxID=947010 RepID=A0A9X4JVZ4_9FIRM|nr:DUF1819 family protein [Pelotomaculum isophthalicicum]MDF9408218.1 DUF1819 family protein [Pelotomaculum isophthalicicum JI]